MKGFDGILRYINDLSGSLDIGDLLTRAELLFIKFKQMVELIDRNATKLQSQNTTNGSPENSNGNPLKHTVSTELRGLLSREIIIQKEETRTSETPFG